MENRTATGMKTGLYGSFQLAEFELALSVSALQEVVNYPAAVTRIPLAPRHLLGLFNLRGTLIPIVDLRPLLGLQSAEATADSKVAVIELGDIRVGLLFDTTGEILRVSSEQSIAFNPSDTGPSVICGALKLDDGERILQILSPAAVLGLPDVPQLHHRTRQSEQRTRHAQRRQTVSFRVADAHLALPMTAIQEIIRVPALHPSPLADDLCIGMLNLRGNTIPVIDFARFMGLTGTAEAPSANAMADERRIVILQQNDVHFGLMVADVRSIVGYHDDELLPMPAYARREIALFAGCLDGNGRESVILLNPDALFAHPRITAITRGHRELFRDAATAAASRQQLRGTRETCVTFRLGHLMGVPISQLREVIDYSDEIVRTPGSPDFVLGVLNLRHELVTVFDVRAMLGMPPYENMAQTKILIVRHRDEKFGLVVDAVDNIVTIDSASRFQVPAMLTKQATGSLRNCLKDAVEIPGAGTLMLIDLTLLCEHVTTDAMA